MPIRLDLRRALAGPLLLAVGLLAGSAWPAAGAGSESFTPAETRAALALAELARCQARFQAAGRLDRDRDRLGEFGFLQELAGSYAACVASLDQDEYRISVFLPDAEGQGILEGTACPARSARSWCAYAWPASSTASRVFFVDQSGQVRVAPLASLSRPQRQVPAWNAACPPTLCSMGPRPWPTCGEWAFLP